MKYENPEWNRNYPYGIHADGTKIYLIYFYVFFGIFPQNGRGYGAAWKRCNMNHTGGGAAMETNTEAEMLEDMAKRFCPNCGAAVTPNGRGRPRIFCSEPCRYAWKNRNPHPENWKSTRTAICPECGKPFLASREYGRVRKYCSHACANRGRAKRKEREGNEG